MPGSRTSSTTRSGAWFVAKSSPSSPDSARRRPRSPPAGGRTGSPGRRRTRPRRSGSLRTSAGCYTGTPFGPAGGSAARRARGSPCAAVVPWAPRRARSRRCAPGPSTAAWPPEVDRHDVRPPRPPPDRRSPRPARDHRQEGRPSAAPAGCRRVLYGHGVRSENVSVDAPRVRSAASQGRPHALIDLSVDGDKARPVLIYGVQLHPVNRRPLHVDLFLVRMTEELTVDVPLVTVDGTADAVEKLGGTLLHISSTIKVRALPDHLPGQSSPRSTRSPTSMRWSTSATSTIPGDVTLLTDGDEIVAQGPAAARRGGRGGARGGRRRRAGRGGRGRRSVEPAPRRSRPRADLRPTRRRPSHARLAPHPAGPARPDTDRTSPCGEPMERGTARRIVVVSFMLGLLAVRLCYDLPIGLNAPDPDDPRPRRGRAHPTGLARASTRSTPGRRPRPSR